MSTREGTNQGNENLSILPPAPYTPTWVQVWSIKYQRWLPTVKFYDMWSELKPGDIITPFDHLEDVHPKDVLLIVGHPELPLVSLNRLVA